MDIRIIFAVPIIALIIACANTLPESKPDGHTPKGAILEKDV